MEKFLKVFGNFGIYIRKIFVQPVGNCRSMFRLIRKTPAKYTKILRITLVNRKC